ncbi:MAG: DUF4386 domain-containing protein [Anaerolinea sp.]|nr:DUF4386 domain-containing protein [Anaerolinea sp.]
MMKSLKKIARSAGILYFIMDVFLIFGGIFVESKLYVPGNAEVTLNNILSNVMLFRLGFASILIGHTLILFLVLVLYNLFISVDKAQARLMVILVVAAVPVAFLNMINQYVPILLLSNAGYLSVFSAAQLQSLSMVFLEMYQHGNMIAEIFWGLWLIPLGILVYKSGFIPKVLGVLLFVGCVGHLISFISTFVFPGYSTILTPLSEIAMIGELPIFFWLLIKGAKEKTVTS